MSHSFKEKLRGAFSHNVCNKNAVAKRTLIDKFTVSGAMVHFTFFLLLDEVPIYLVNRNIFLIHFSFSMYLTDVSTRDSKSLFDIAALTVSRISG
jgi:hypothetical protein